MPAKTATRSPPNQKTKRPVTRNDNDSKALTTAARPAAPSGWVQQIAAGNAGWRLQFRFAVHAGWFRVPELWTLVAAKEFMTDSQDTVSEMAANEPRDTALLRWAKFLSIIVVLAVLVGGLFGISIHVVALHSAAKFTLDHPNRYRLSGAAKYDVDRSAADTKQAFKQRFIIGSSIGGVIGLVYVIRCLVKNEDP